MNTHTHTSFHCFHNCPCTIYFRCMPPELVIKSLNQVNHCKILRIANIIGSRQYIPLVYRATYLVQSVLGGEKQLPYQWECVGLSGDVATCIPQNGKVKHTGLYIYGYCTYRHVHERSVIETRQSKATTPEDNSLFPKRKRRAPSGRTRIRDVYIYMYVSLVPRPSHEGEGLGTRLHVCTCTCTCIRYMYCGRYC